MFEAVRRYKGTLLSGLPFGFSLSTDFLPVFRRRLLGCRPIYLLLIRFPAKPSTSKRNKNKENA
jgi:hypothetical protein